MRPKLHFTPKQNWMNDPNGLIYYQGKYHLFYQHFPYAPHWGTMHWGHATTTDFIHFEHLPIALYPSRPYDQNGCFSGSAIYFKNHLNIYYTAIKYNSMNENNIHLRNNEDDTTASQAMVTSIDGYHFENKQMVIQEHPQSRDPKAWIGHNGHVYLAIGSEFNNIGTLLFYESEDGIHFTYKNKYQNSLIGDMWECPDIFKLDGQYFLMLCPENIDKEPKPNCNAIIMPIDFDEETCSISNVQDYQYLDYGLDFYAPQSFVNEDNQRTLLAWMRMRQPFKDENWVGMFSFPRVLKHQNGHIYQDVYPTIKNLFQIKTNEISFNQPFLLKTALKNNEMINLGNFKIYIEDDCLVCDRRQVSINHKKVCNLNYSPKLNGKYDLDIYYDYGIFEIYINQGQYVMSQIVYNLNENIITYPNEHSSIYKMKE